MAINNQPTIEPRTVTGIFTKYIAKTLPLAFDESMSYYECLCALLEYINEDIVPDINNVNDGLGELQTFYTQLQTYVNTYFDSLDVQDEINNKLDEMAQDGTITNLIKDYVDPIYQNYENSINNEIDTFTNSINSQISIIDRKVDSATSGSPLVASSTAGMTDTTRVYVNTTDGKWYYYDGDSWEIGGTYQSTGISTSDPTIEDIYDNLDVLNRATYITQNINDEFIPNGYISTNVEVGAVVSLDVTSTNSYNYLIKEVKKGDIFTITGWGGATARLWCFTDSTYHVLSKADSNATLTNSSIKADYDGYVIINTNPSKNGNNFNVDYSYTYTNDEIKDRLDYIEFKKLENIVQVKGLYYFNQSTSIHFGELYTNHTDFCATNMIKVNSGDIIKLKASFGDNIGVIGYDNDKQPLYNVMDTSSDSINKVQRGYITHTCTIPENVYYITISTITDDEIILYSNGNINEENPKIDILVAPVSNTKFYVYCYSEQTHKYLRHQFTRQYYTKNFTYGDNLSKNVVCTNIWYSDHIYDGNDTNRIASGNFNFIHYINNISGSTGYVGAGHGCIVMNWSLFKIDNYIFDPLNFDKKYMPTGTQFEFIIKGDNYLIDTENTSSGDNAIPKVDSNADPIITSRNIIHAYMTNDNNITYRNKLIILMNNIQFREVHAGMCETYSDYFNNVIVNNNTEDWNSITYDDSEHEATISLEGNTNNNMFNNYNTRADKVIMYGDNYEIYTQVLNIDSSRNKLINTRSAIYPMSTECRMKFYLMPALCYITTLKSGESIETFNTGDVLDCIVTRQIITK